MYNAQRKNDFISETGRSESFGQSLFHTTKPYEQEAGKDFAELPIEVLQKLFNKSFGVRKRSNESVMSFFRSYVVWCKERGYAACDDVYLVKTNTEEKVKRVMVGSPKHLEMILDRVFEPTSEGTTECLYRAYFWFAFSGLPEEDALSLCIDDIDFNTMTIEKNGRTYDIYREAVPALKVARDADVFKYIHPKYTEEKQGKFRKRKENQFVFRGIRSECAGMQAVRSFSYKRLRQYGVELSYGRVRLSGLFYSTYELERIGEPVDFSTYIMERIEMQNGTQESSKRMARDIRRRMMSDYQAWKNVFSI